MRARTLPRLFERAVHEHGPRTAMRYRRDGDWHPITYAQLGRRVQQAAAGLVEIGLEPGETVLVGGRPGPRRAIADLASLQAGAVNLSPPSGGDLGGSGALAEAAEVRVAFAEDREHGEALADAFDPATLVVFEEAEADRPSDSARRIGLDELVAEGQRARKEGTVDVGERWRSIEPDDPARLAPTPGEDGAAFREVPHRRLAETVYSLASATDLDPGDRCLCLSVEDEGLRRLAGRWAVLHQGAQTWYGGSPQDPCRLVDEVGPDLLVAGPQALAALRAEIDDRLEASQPTQRRLFAWARSLGERRLEADASGEGPGLGLRLRHGLADRLVLAQVRAVLGLDRLEAALAPGESLEAELERWLRAIGVPLQAAYTPVPAGGLVALEREDHRGPGSVGRPLPGADVRIGGSGEEGEILVRAPLEGEGWLPTGDLGRIDEDGVLYLRREDA